MRFAVKRQAKLIFLSATITISFVGCADIGNHRLQTRFNREHTFRPKITDNAFRTGDISGLKSANVALISSSERASTEELADRSDFVALASGAEPSAVSTTVAAPFINHEVATLEPVSVMTLAQLEQLAIENNPALNEIRSSINAARGIRYQVGQRANPTVGYFGSQLGDARTDQHGAFVDQEFVRGNKLQLNQCILEQSIRRLAYQLDVQRYRISTDVRQVYAEALAAQDTEQFCAAFRNELLKGIRIAEARKLAGEGTQTEILQFQIFENEASLLQQQSQQRFMGAWNEMTSIAGVAGLSPSPLASQSDELAIGELPQSEGLGDQVEAIIATSPELSAARAKVGEARAVLTRQQAQSIPNLHMQMGAGADYGTGANLINIQVGAPVPVFNKNRGNIQAAFADFNRAHFEVRRIEMNVRARFARAQQELQSAASAVSQYDEKILPNAVETLRLSEIAYQAGEADFLHVLVARRTYFDANLKSISARRDYARAQAHIQGMLLTGSLDSPDQLNRDDAVRAQSFDGQ